jgi:hypothetical protein
MRCEDDAKQKEDKRAEVVREPAGSGCYTVLNEKNKGGEENGAPAPASNTSHGSEADRARQHGHDQRSMSEIRDDY